MDRKIKYSLYEKYGVAEYWIVEPVNQILEQYVLKNGRYERNGAFTYEDTVRCVSVAGLDIDLSRVFEENEV